MNSLSILQTSIIHFTTQKCVSQSVNQAMLSRHLCPCCGSTLLRHTHSGKIYWRCSSCYQSMPV